MPDVPDAARLQGLVEALCSTYGTDEVLAAVGAHMRTTAPAPVRFEMPRALLDAAEGFSEGFQRTLSGLATRRQSEAIQQVLEGRPLDPRWDSMGPRLAAPRDRVPYEYIMYVPPMDPRTAALVPGPPAPPPPPPEPEPEPEPPPEPPAGPAYLRRFANLIPPKETP